MSIISGYKRVKNYIYENGSWKLLSRWTSSDAVEMSDGTTLDDKISEIEENVTTVTKSLGTQCTMVLTGDVLTITSIDTTST